MVLGNWDPRTRTQVCWPPGSTCLTPSTASFCPSSFSSFLLYPKGPGIRHLNPRSLQLVTSLLSVFNTNSLSSWHVCFVGGLPYSLGTGGTMSCYPSSPGLRPHPGPLPQLPPSHAHPQQGLRGGPSSLSTKCVNHLFTGFSCLALGVPLAISSL